LVKNKISIKLDKQQLSCEYICKHIQQLINNHTSQNINLSNYLLVCELKEVTDSNQTLLLRIGVNYE
jgi:hypothetical protein